MNEVTDKTFTLSEYRDFISEGNPDFAHALHRENEFLVACRRLRRELKQLRKTLKKSQKEIAEALQQSQSGVSRFEKGEGDVGFLTVCRYAAALGMQPVVNFIPSEDAIHDGDNLGNIIRAMDHVTDMRAAEFTETSGNEGGLPADAEIRVGALRADAIAALAATVAQGVSLSMMPAAELSKPRKRSTENEPRKAPIVRSAT